MCAMNTLKPMNEAKRLSSFKVQVDPLLKLAKAAEVAAYLETIDRAKAKCSAYSPLMMRFTRMVRHYRDQARLASDT